MKSVKSSQSMIAFKVSPDMKDWLQTKAKEGYRSMSAQILLFLDGARESEKSKAAKTER